LTPRKGAAKDGRFDSIRAAAQSNDAAEKVAEVSEGNLGYT